MGRASEQGLEQFSLKRILSKHPFTPNCGPLYLEQELLHVGRPFHDGAILLRLRQNQLTLAHTCGNMPQSSKLGLLWGNFPVDSALDYS